MNATLGQVDTRALTDDRHRALAQFCREQMTRLGHGELPDPVFQRLFVDGAELPLAGGEGRLPAEVLEAGLMSGLLEQHAGAILSRFRATYVEGFCTFSDPKDGPREDPTYLDPLWEGPKFGRFIVRQRGTLGLDLGCGCGNYALLLSTFCDTVCAVDLNERAIDMTRFNARLNGVEHRVAALHGDLFAPVADLTFDCIVSTVPGGFRTIVPLDNPLLAADFVLAERTFAGIGRHLSATGWAHVIAVLPRRDPLATVRRWLGAGDFQIFAMLGVLRHPEFTNAWLYIRRGAPVSQVLARHSLSMSAINPVDHIPAEWLSLLMSRLLRA